MFLLQPQLRTIKTEDSNPEPCSSSSGSGTSSSTDCHSILNPHQHGGSAYHHHHHHHHLAHSQTIKELHTSSPASLPPGFNSNNLSSSSSPSCSVQSPSGVGCSGSRTTQQQQQAPVALKASSSAAAGSSTAMGMGSGNMGVAATAGPSAAVPGVKVEMEIIKKVFYHRLDLFLQCRHYPQKCPLFQLRSRLLETEEKLSTLNASHNKLLQDLHDFVECPVCFNVPRLPPVTCCRNGHLICNRCRGEDSAGILKNQSHKFKYFPFVPRKMCELSLLSNPPQLCPR